MLEVAHVERKTARFQNLNGFEKTECVGFFFFGQVAPAFIRKTFAALVSNGKVYKTGAIDCRTFRTRQTFKTAQWLKLSTIPPLFYIQGYGAFLLCKTNL
jgi:hypothetical protein